MESQSNEVDRYSKNGIVIVIMRDDVDEYSYELYDEATGECLEQVLAVDDLYSAVHGAEICFEELVPNADSINYPRRTLAHLTATL